MNCMTIKKKNKTWCVGGRGTNLEASKVKSGEGGKLNSA